MDEAEKYLVERLRAGDEAAYKHLFDYHYRALCYFAKEYVGDNYVAESIVSGVVFHLWEKRRSLNVDTSLRRYLMAAVRNQSINYLKSLKTAKSMKATSLDSTVENSILSDELPTGRLFAKELETEIGKAVGSLPEECRRVFLKSRVDGKKYSEIASDLGISVNTVKYHIKNALAALTIALEKFLVIFLFFSIK